MAFPSTGLRFFTVYGPWGRPDMAPMIFTRAISAGEPIKVFNHGEMWRDFTYIDDIVDGVLRALDRPASGTPPHKLYNLGNHKSEKLTDFIAAIEQALQKKGDHPAGADAARRCAGDLCRYRSQPPRSGFRARHAHVRRHSQIRRLVPGLLRR